GAQIRGVEEAQIIGVQLVQVLQGIDECASGLGHLLAIDGEMPMHDQPRGTLEIGSRKHRRPKQRVEVDDVLPDDVNDLRLGILRPVIQRVLGLAGFLRPALGGGDVTDRSVKPNVEELVGFAGNGKPKVGSIAADVPIGQALLEKLLELIADRRVQETWLANHPEQEVLMSRQPKEKM